MTDKKAIKTSSGFYDFLLSALLNLLNFAQSPRKCFNFSFMHKKRLDDDLTLTLLHFFELFPCLSGGLPSLLYSISTPTCLIRNDPAAGSLYFSLLFDLKKVWAYSDVIILNLFTINLCKESNPGQFKSRPTCLR